MVDGIIFLHFTETVLLVLWHTLGYLAGTDLLKLSQGLGGPSYVKDSSGILAGLHVCFVQNK